MLILSSRSKSPFTRWLRGQAGLSFSFIQSMTKHNNSTIKVLWFWGLLLFCIPFGAVYLFRFKLIGTWACKSTYSIDKVHQWLTESTFIYRNDGRSVFSTFIKLKSNKFPRANLQWSMTGAGTYSRNYFNGTSTYYVRNFNVSNMSFVDGTTIQQDQELRRILDETFDLEGHYRILFEDPNPSKLRWQHSDKFVSQDLDNPDLYTNCTRTNASWLIPDLWPKPDHRGFLLPIQLC